jgi:hypothetical protein
MFSAFEIIMDNSSFRATVGRMISIDKISCVMYNSQLFQVKIPLPNRCRQVYLDNCDVDCYIGDLQIT